MTHIHLVKLLEPIGHLRRLARPLAVLFVAGLALAPCAVHASAGAPARPAVTSSRYTNVLLSSLGWTVQTVTGSNPVLDLYVPGPGDVAFGSTTRLSLVYSTSPGLDPANSSLSVMVNSVYAGGRLLTGGANGPATLTFSIPPSALIGNGNNHMQLTFALRGRAARGACLNDPTLSASIYGTSVMRYDVRGPAPITFNPDLARLPAPFVPAASASVPVRIAVGLPDQPTTTELSGVGRILARLGEDAPAQPSIAVSLPARALPQRGAQDNLVLIGTPRDNPAIKRLVIPPHLRLVRGQWMDERNRILPASEGVILEAHNPWDNTRAALVVSGNGQEGIGRAATLLGSDTLRRLLHGDMALLPTAPRVPLEVPVSGNHLSLSNLGYPSTTLEGVGEQVARYTFDLARLPSAAGSLTLVYGHSATAAAAVSSVRVDLNGSPLASQRLDPSDPVRIRWQIALPVDQLHVGSNTLAVHFYLSAPDTGCAVIPYSSMWATIDASSDLTLPPTGAAGSPDLGALPYPMESNGNPNNTLIIVPSRAVDVGGALSAVMLLGAASRIDAPQPTVLAADQVTAAQLKGHTVVLDGLSTRDRLVTQLRAHVPLWSAANGSPLQLGGARASVQGTASGQSAVGIVAELSSPWDSTHMALLITATPSTLLSSAQRLLFQGSLSGTAATIDAAGQVQTFDTRVQPGQPEAGLPPARPIRSLTMLGVGLLALVLALGAIQSLRSERKLA